MNIDLRTNSALVNWLRGYPASMPMKIMVGGKRQEAADVSVVGGELVIVCSAILTPSEAETTAALNAGMVEGAPEAA